MIYAKMQTLAGHFSAEIGNHHSALSYAFLDQIEDGEQNSDRDR